MRSMHILAPILLFASAASAADDRPVSDKPGAPDRRLSWDDSQVVGSPDPPLPYKTARAFPKLTVKQPLSLTPEPGTDRLFILEHLQYWAGPGRLVAIRDDQDADEARTLLDIDGLAVGLAFHPDYGRNGYLFIGLNAPTRGRPKATQVVRYTVDPRSPDRIDPASKRLIIEWPSNGHDGGDIAFGIDGYLYISTGDGSSDSDANLTGQNLGDLQGSVLRIDVDRADEGRDYGVPKDNPFVDRRGARPELWCYGLRNPWRMSYDRESGQLWVGNNGQDLWEQVYLIRKGANYGWSITEGSHTFRALRELGPDPISPPAAEHPHSEARSLTGGRVYRGRRLPDLVGAYVYGDWSTGRVWGIKHDGKEATWHRQLVDTPFSITGFGTDHAGELYVIDEVTGFYRLDPTTEADRPSRPFPTRLSQTGVFASVAPPRLHPAAIPYQVVAPQWADGARIDRAAALTGLERIEQKPQRNAGGAWTFPNGSVLVQTLSLDLPDAAGKATPKRIETRLLARQQGEWIGYSYRWNAEQTDAELVRDSGDGDEFEIADPVAQGGRREIIWKFPSRAECLACHSRAAGFVLGFTPLQLDRDVDHGGKLVNQSLDLERLGVFQGPLPRRPDDRPRLVDPRDPQAPLEARVRSYLDVNCSTCHVKEGGGNARMELGLNTSTGRMHLIDESPVHSTLGIDDARLVAPGLPERSVLYQRISRRGGEQMPPLVSTEVDRQAVELIGDWIRSLAPAAR
jgi:glucose/arabinose dehydrogenase/mono/diheme cytochrome c family protein